MKKSLLFLLFQAFCFASDSLDDYIFETAPSKLGKLYKYEKKLMSTYDKEVANWSKYAKQNPLFNLKALIEALVYSAERQKDSHLQDVDKTPSIFYSFELCKILWEEGEVRSTNVLIASLLYPQVDPYIQQQFGKRVYQTVEELSVEDVKHLSLDGQYLLLADLIYKLRNIESNKDVALTNKALESLKKLHGVSPALEKILLELILKKSS